MLVCFTGANSEIKNGPANVTYDSDLDSGRRDLVFSYPTLEHDGDYKCSVGPSA